MAADSNGLRELSSSGQPPGVMEHSQKYPDPKLLARAWLTQCKGFTHIHMLHWQREIPRPKKSKMGPQ